MRASAARSTTSSSALLHNDQRGATSATSQPSATTSSAPTKLPIEKHACSRLITGRRRACSTLTPRAFIATSIAPLPSPKTAAPTIRTGVVGREPHHHGAGRHHRAADQRREAGAVPVGERAAEVHREDGDDGRGHEHADDVAGAQGQVGPQPGQRPAEDADGKTVGEEQARDSGEVAVGALSDRGVRRPRHRTPASACGRGRCLPGTCRACRSRSPPGRCGSSRRC